MKMYEIGTLVVIVVCIVMGVGAASSYFAGPDNKIEEICEDIIEVASGAEIDLSKDTPEEPTQPPLIDEEAAVQLLREVAIRNAAVVPSN